MTAVHSLHRRGLRFRHREPKDQECQQAHRRDTHKRDSAAEPRRKQSKQRCAERSPDSGHRSDHALRQIEAARAARHIGDNQRRQHAQHRSTDAVEQLKNNEQRRIESVANSSARTGKAAKPISRSGRRPQLFAARPTQGANRATRIYGRTINAETTSDERRSPS